jgi:hypothetical protein
LEVLEARKPALKAVFLLADKIIDHHSSSVMNKIAARSCQER